MFGVQVFRSPNTRTPEHLNTMNLDDWNWTIGVVVGPFGIRGEVKVRYETDFPERFAELKEVCLRNPKGMGQLFKVKGLREHKGQALLKIIGIERIEDVELWRHAKVQVRRSDAVALPEDEFYTADIIGFVVATTDGREVGKLERVQPYPAYDLWIVGDAMIPAVKEIVKEVNTAERRILIDPPPGMLPGEEPEDAD